MTQNNAIKVHSWSPMGTDRKPVCYFLCVNNTNLRVGSTSYLLPFQDIADYWSNFCLRQGLYFFALFNALVGVNP